MVIATTILQPIDPWELARRQHGVISHEQLRALGFSEAAIRHRLQNGRLFALRRGLYAVGRPDVSRRGHWMEATLVSGTGAALDGESGLALWDVRSSEGKEIEVAIPESARRTQPGIKLRRVRGLADQVTEIDGIPVLSLPPLFVQLADRVRPSALEAAINEADKKDLIHVEQLRHEIDALGGRRGVATLRRVIDRATFRYSDSELERAMRPIIRKAGLGEPEMGEMVNGYKVDFWWPALNFVIETDGGRFHRTAFQQTRDRRRDQAHTLAHTAHLRFTHSQIRFERSYVEWSVAKMARDLMQSVGGLWSSQQPQSSNR